MATKLRAGSQLTLAIDTRDPDTQVPIGGLPVFLDFLPQAAAAPEQVAGAQTDAMGRAVVTVKVPAAPGSYVYRARMPGVADQYRADISPNLSVTVV